MNILFVTTRFPYPAKKGDQVVCLNRLKTLSRKHRVTLVSLTDGKIDNESITKLESYCESLHLIEDSKISKLVRLAKRKHGKPLQVSYYDSRNFAAAVKALVAEKQIDVVHGFLLRSTEALLEFRDRTFLELIDCMKLNLENRIPHSSIPLKPILNFELKRIQNYQKKISGMFRHLSLVSEKDRKSLEAMHSQVIPNGVAYENRPRKTEPNKIVFSGNLAYHANVAAISWFTEEVLPLIQRKNPKTQFEIVGCTPNQFVRRLAQKPGVTLSADVDDLKSHLLTAALAVAPMRSGSGIQNKVLEALALGVPVVATKFATGGLSAESSVVIANRAQEFADAVSDLLTDRVRNVTLGEQGKAYVRQFHSWDVAANQIDKIYQSIAGKGSRRAHRIH